MHVLGLRAASKENHWAGMPYVKLSAEKKKQEVEFPCYLDDFFPHRTTNTLGQNFCTKKYEINCREILT